MEALELSSIDSDVSNGQRKKLRSLVAEQLARPLARVDELHRVAGNQDHRSRITNGPTVPQLVERRLDVTELVL